MPHRLHAVLAAATAPVRVLIVDDSVVARSAMARVIDESDGLAVAGLASGAAQARAWLAQDRADVIVLDLEMPGMGGLDALPDLILAGQGARVLIVSSHAAAGAAATVRAMMLGAADTLEKPVSGLGLGFGRALIDRIARLGVVDRPLLSAYSLRTTSSAPIGLLAIGASTGGIAALARFFAVLPHDFAAPILITQHLPASFSAYFAAQVAVMTARPTTVACEGEAVTRGRVLIAPGNAHLTVAEGRARLTDTPAATGNRPSVDPMFASLACRDGERACAVMLSGMGRDGLEGAASLVAAGGSLIAQDAASSAVWGMPGSVARAGLASLVAPPEMLAEHIAARGSR